MNRSSNRQSRTRRADWQYRSEGESNRNEEQWETNRQTNRTSCLPYDRSKKVVVGVVRILFPCNFLLVKLFELRHQSHFERHGQILGNHSKRLEGIMLIHMTMQAAGSGLPTLLPAEYWEPVTDSGLFTTFKDLVGFGLVPVIHEASPPAGFGRTTALPLEEGAGGTTVMPSGGNIGKTPNISCGGGGGMPFPFELFEAAGFLVPPLLLPPFRGGKSSSIISGSSINGKSRGSGVLGGSGMGHMCIVMVQSGSTTVSQTCGRMMSPLGPTRS